jgi:high-affinity nickel permease
LINSLDPILHSTGYQRAVACWYLGLIPVALALGVHAWRHFGTAYGVFTIASLTVAALSGMAGMGRYILVLFPIFMSAGMLLRNRIAFVAVCAACLPFLVWFADEFAHWRNIN